MIAASTWLFTSTKYAKLLYNVHEQATPQYCWAGGNGPGMQLYANRDSFVLNYMYDTSRQYMLLDLLNILVPATK